jgi:methylated-DNA-[protein]-cysteine S-methyltransferase
MMLVCKTIRTPQGPMLLAASEAGLAGAWFEGQSHHPDTSAWSVVRHQAWLDSAEQELMVYFNGKGALQDFFTPRVAAWGTPFQHSVWQALCAIPYGSTCSYGQLATQLNKPLAVRAVGAAVGRNPWSVIVPCHRVLGAQGQLTGYAGGLERKRALLTLEGVAL